MQTPRGGNPLPFANPCRCGQSATALHADSRHTAPFVITRGRVMPKFLLATVALIAFAGPAITADMRAPVYKAPPPVVPAWSWTGCFAGGDAGSLRTKQGWTHLPPGG